MKGRRPVNLRPGLFDRAFLPGMAIVVFYLATYVWSPLVNGPQTMQQPITGNDLVELLVRNEPKLRLQLKDYDRSLNQARQIGSRPALEYFNTLFANEETDSAEAADDHFAASSR